MVNVLKFRTPKFPDKVAYANSADPDQTVQGLHNSTKYFMKQAHKKQNLGQNVWNKVYEILGHYEIYEYYVPHHRGGTYYF